MGRMLPQANAKTQLVTVGAQLTDILQQVNAEVASYNAAKQALDDAHAATMEPLKKQQGLLEGRMADLAEQANQPDEIAPGFNPNNPHP